MSTEYSGLSRALKRRRGRRGDRRRRRCRLRTNRLCFVRRKTDRDPIAGLTELELNSVPAWGLLGEMTGTPVAKMRQLAEARRINSKTAFDILLSAFERKYNGLAAKRAEQLKRRNG